MRTIDLIHVAVFGTFAAATVSLILLAPKDAPRPKPGDSLVEVWRTWRAQWKCVRLWMTSEYGRSGSRERALMMIVRAQWILCAVFLALLVIQMILLE